MAHLFEGATSAPPPSARDQGGPRAIGRVLSLLNLLARRRDGMTLSELSQALDVPKSTFLASLRGLAADGYLVHRAGVYALGPAAFRLAGAMMAAWSMPDVMRHYVQELAQATNESVGFAVADWDIGQAIYADGVSSRQTIHYSMRPGIRVPLYASAAGRVLLAHASPAQRHAYFTKAHFRALTPATLTDPTEILAALEAIARQGYCASFGEMLKDTAAIAAPVFDAHDQPLGALFVAGPLERLKAHEDELLAEVLRHAAAASGHASPLRV
nr:IclR family transcriptional regulator [uncultured Brevundimonas sp.]